MVRVEDAIWRRGWLLRLQRRRVLGVVGEFGRKSSSDGSVPVDFFRLPPHVVGAHMSLRGQRLRLARPAVWALVRLLGRNLGKGWGGMWSHGCRGLRCLRAPLGTRGTSDRGSLVRLGVNILRRRRRGLELHTRALTTSQELQPRLDVLVGGIQLCGALVGIESIVGLVVARLVLKLINCAPAFGVVIMTYQCSEVIPHLRDVRVEADRTGVRVQGISVLVDLVVENTDGAPECGVSAITVDRLLVRFIRLGILCLRHIATSQEIPTLGIVVVLDVLVECALRGTERQLTSADRLLEIFDRKFLAFETAVLLVVKPAKLL